ncbi:MAG: DNA repair protein RadC, partial [Bacilli bacterium]|nr:DNA repair protein RadC [Bacilli bacterium]
MYLIKDMPYSERPRERLMRFGAASLSTSELIAIVLASGSRDLSVIEIAKSIVNDTNAIIELKDKTVSELSQTKGVGKVKAIKILAAIELGRRVYEDMTDISEIRSPGDVYRLLKDEVAGIKQEVLYALFLDLKMRLIAKRQIFVGSLNQSLIHPREVFKYAVKNSAY